MANFDICGKCGGPVGRFSRRSLHLTHRCKVRHGYKMPVNWSDMPGACEAVAIRDLTLSKASRLRCKLLFFQSNESMSYFWKRNLSGPLTPDTLACVQQLSYQKDGVSFVDPNFFAVAAFVTSRGGLSAATIAHECGHIAMAYARRHNRRLWSGPHELEEEEICYPLGIAAGMIHAFLREVNYFGVYDEPE